ncbi:MAG: wax ester/triacylglycerol synthase family O-acyltransferase [Acidimicrobiales bacterium]
MDRLSPLDASFLHIEDDVNHMHIGSIGIFEGPPPAYEDLTRTVAGRLHLVPRYRQKVATVPLSLGRPVWVDDPYFTVEYHVRHTALPAPGGDAELRRLVGRVMSQQLDRSKPLWEMWMVEGLDDNRWAMVSKVHHCLVDGVSGAELMAVVFDLSPDVPEPVDDDWRPAPEPSALQLARDATVGLVTSPYEQMRAVGAMLRRPRWALDAAQEVAKGSVALSSIVKPTAPTSLNGPIGPHRTYVWETARLADVKAIRLAHGGTVNDVVLALITRGFRDLLTSRGEAVEDRVIRTLVPVSVRPRDAGGTATGDGTLENKVSAMFAELPVGIDDPVERLHAISAQLSDLKESKQALAGEAITSLGGFAPPMLLSLGMRVASRAARRMGNLDTVTTNVPGPQFPLYSCGRRLLRACPYVPLAAPLRVGVSIFSYDGELTFGVTGDYDSASDIDVLAKGIGAGVAELLPSANGHREGAGAAATDGARATPTGTVTAQGTAAVSNGRRSSGRAAKPAGRPAGGKATAGKATAGKASAGKPSAGKATAGKPSAGKATAGKPSAGKATAGKATPKSKATRSQTAGAARKTSGPKSTKRGTARKASGGKARKTAKAAASNARKSAGGDAT